MACRIVEALAQGSLAVEVARLMTLAGETDGAGVDSWTRGRALGIGLALGTGACAIGVLRRKGYGPKRGLKNVKGEEGGEALGLGLGWGFGLGESPSPLARPLAGPSARLRCPVYHPCVPLRCGPGLELSLTARPETTTKVAKTDSSDTVPASSWGCRRSWLH